MNCNFNTIMVEDYCNFTVNYMAKAELAVEIFQARTSDWLVHLFCCLL
jgi:hypothetical protein